MLIKREDSKETNNQKRKEDAIELAQLIYDLFMESGLNSTTNTEKTGEDDA